MLHIALLVNPGILLQKFKGPGDDLPGHGLGLPERMDIDRHHRTCHLATETCPAIAWILNLCLVLLVHDDHVSRTELQADAASDTNVPVDFTYHLIAS